MRRTKRALAVVAFTLVSCTTAAVPASTPTSNTATLRLLTTTAVLPLVNDLTAHYTQIEPSVNFEIVSGNYQTLFDRLMADQSGYFITQYLPENTLESSLLAWPLGQDGIAVITHPDNSLAGLTSDDLRRIYLGHVTRWSEVGGPDQDISIFSREDGSATRAVFEQLLMGQRLTTQSAQVAPSSAAMLSAVAATPGSIGYVSMGYLDSSVRTLAIGDVLPTPNTVYDNLYPLRSTLFMVGLSEPNERYRAFLGWVQSQDGQEIVAQHYAPLLRP